MHHQSYLLIGLQKIIEKHMEFLLVTEFYLIMSHLAGVKLLLQEKLQWDCQKLP